MPISKALVIPVEGDVQIWVADLDRTTEELATVGAYLSQDECARADRFAFESHRVRFRAARGILRALLGAYLGEDPRSVEFSYGTHGKPELAKAPEGLTFNLSHSDGVGIFAFARRTAIGVDVERIDHDLERGAVAEVTFAPAETASLAALDPAMQEEAFFATWSRKEAYLKALGSGFSIAPRTFVVSVDPRVEPRLLVAAPDASTSAEEADRWTFGDLRVRPGYAAAYALRRSPVRVTMVEWELSPG